MGVGFCRRRPHIPALRPTAADRAAKVDDPLLAADAVVVTGEIAANPQPHNLISLCLVAAPWQAECQRTRAREAREIRCANVQDSAESSVRVRKIARLGRADNGTDCLQICSGKYLIHRAGTWPARIAARPARTGRGQRRHGRAGRPFGVYGEDRELFLERLAGAGRTGRCLRSLNQGLEGVPAVPADVLEDRHRVGQAFRPAEPSV